MKRIFAPLAWLLALLTGFGIGLGYTWIIAPAQQVEAAPHMLRNDFKDDFRSAIAAAYASNADLERARARLALLGDPDPYQALTAQAQRMLAAGQPAESVQKVALLAASLQSMQPVAVEPTIAGTEEPGPTTEGSNQPPGAEPSAQTEIASAVTELPGEPVSTETLQAGSPEPATEADTTGTPVPGQSPTPRPTRTATPTLGAPYQLVGEDTVCDPALEEGLLQVVVTNVSRRQVPGAEIVITWNSGEEHIFTGLKPELGHGYADFLMTPGVIYAVRMADGGTPASELIAPECTAEDGETYLGGFRLTFQQP